jgi:hypothetical protein
MEGSRCSWEGATVYDEGQPLPQQPQPVPPQPLRQPPGSPTVLLFLPVLFAVGTAALVAALVGGFILWQMLSRS